MHRHSRYPFLSLFFALALCVAGWLALTPTPAYACSSVVTVLNGNDSGADTLRQAIADICPGGTIRLIPV